MPEFHLRADQRRISVDSRHVAAVVDEQQGATIILGCGLTYDLQEFYSDTINRLKGLTNG